MGRVALAEPVPGASTQWAAKRQKDLPRQSSPPIAGPICHCDSSTIVSATFPLRETSALAATCQGSESHHQQPTLKLARGKLNSPTSNMLDLIAATRRCASREHQVVDMLVCPAKCGGPRPDLQPTRARCCGSSRHWKVGSRP